MHEIESRHGFVRHLRIDSYHLRVIKRRDETQIVPGGRHIDVAAGLIGLRFEGELVSITLGEVVFAKIVNSVAETLHGFIRATAGVGLSPFTSTPKHEYLRAQFGAQIHGAHCLLQRVGADFGIVSSKSAVAKNGMEE